MESKEAQRIYHIHISSVYSSYANHATQTHHLPLPPPLIQTALLIIPINIARSTQHPNLLPHFSYPFTRETLPENVYISARYSLIRKARDPREKQRCKGTYSRQGIHPRFPGRISRAFTRGEDSSNNLIQRGQRSLDYTPLRRTLSRKRI